MLKKHCDDCGSELAGNAERELPIETEMDIGKRFARSPITHVTINFDVIKGQKGDPIGVERPDLCVPCLRLLLSGALEKSLMPPSSIGRNSSKG